ncbi:MAG: NlpC/P60 family protein [Hyphomicrobiaceae bacterium]
MNSTLGSVDNFYRHEVVGIARSWCGTPYHHQASRQGVGVDCLGLVRGVYRTLYGLEAEQFPPYSADWGEATGEETLLGAAHRNLVAKGIGVRKPGDILVFRMRRCAVAKHAAIMTSEDAMVHAIERIGVVEVPIRRWWIRRLAGVFSFPGIND